MTGIASFGGRVAYIGKVADDQLGEVFGHDLRAVGVTFENAPVADRREHRPLPHRGDARRPAHDEHLPRRVVAAQPRRRRRGAGGPRPGRLPRGLPVRPRRRPRRPTSRPPPSPTPRAARCRSRCRTRSASTATATTSSDLVEHAGRHPVRQRGRADGALPGRRLRRRARRPCAATARSPPSRGARRGRWSSPATSCTSIDAHPVDEVVDTTGAGDLYAAGFLYGFTHGCALADCGRLGSLAAAEVISHVGARPLTSLRRLAELRPAHLTRRPARPVAPRGGAGAG